MTWGEKAEKECIEGKGANDPLKFRKGYKEKCSTRREKGEGG